MRTPRQIRSKTSSVEHRTCTNNINRLSRQRTLESLDSIHARRDKNGRGNFSRVSSALAALRTDEVYTDIKRFLDVLGMPDHVHDENTSLVEFVHCPFGWNANGAYEKFGLLVDDDVDEIRELSGGVVCL
jgi:hypothetical protein